MTKKVKRILGVIMGFHDTVQARSGSGVEFHQACKGKCLWERYHQGNPALADGDSATMSAVDCRPVGMQAPQQQARDPHAIDLWHPVSVSESQYRGTRRIA